MILVDFHVANFADTMVGRKAQTSPATIDMFWNVSSSGAYTVEEGGST